MANEPTDLKPESWHRYFAIENNNLAWGLAAKQTRTPEEAARMLDSAHAASFHWGEVGNELNVMRAKTLLAEVHALLGFGQSALDIADEVRGFFLERETDDWEIALVHAIHAHAAASAGARDQHRESYLMAQNAFENIADEADRRIVLETFDQVPEPKEA